ncbi:toxin-antitoxin system, toxin component, HicA family [Neisseria lactamica ATCC 23970]|uniref:Toxin-antitoxin system, toxin component, HicA family n=2 Tax=Neisseria lactamica TaxID=486 RepID=D0WCQ5_NEILA|nr:type II toxin-antitoxin system HicA family toxin [Neisseria lactamica]MBS0040547.1 type II toxin-antitoxin system HicA family toxin [Neisseria sp. Marseille-Q1983]EEZ74623.1 toxin-antitoxin system, toxin component, HicA family [Neisseria lactamica ATCC 23970]KFJ36373.1 ycfA-like family protein [Neisseria lactamica ATCC 23970]SUA17047.1 Probable mRNA interferase HicA [Neisseria lactamica]VTQ47997.1 Probable mRNA interferase HicA [Neisseria lactamica]
MKYSEFKRWLEARGVEFKSQKRGSHYNLRLGDKTSVFPFHGSREMGSDLTNKIKKDLGLK